MVTTLIFVILILLSGFFSSAETAFFSLTHAQLRTILKHRMPHARIVHRLKRNPQSLLATILIGNNIVNLFTASYATVVAAHYFDSAALGIATGTATIFILIFGEIIPKSIAYAKNKSVACLSAWPIYILSLVFSPIVYILGLVNNYFYSILKVPKRTRVTEEEVRTVARLGVEHGSIDYREHEMIENVLEFQDTTVKDVMTPIYRVTSVNGEVPVEQIAYFMSHDGHSRYPVYEGDEDHIVGYVHVNHIMKALNSDERNKPVKEFMSPIASEEETVSIERVFRALKRDRSHMCLIHQKGRSDMYIGIVTMEDIIEEIFGDIEDETDKQVDPK